MKQPMCDIRWKDLYDKNSDRLYAPKQLIPKSDYTTSHIEVTRYRKLLQVQNKESLQIIKCGIIFFMPSNREVRRLAGPRILAPQ